MQAISEALRKESCRGYMPKIKSVGRRLLGDSSVMGSVGRWGPLVNSAGRELQGVQA